MRRTHCGPSCVRDACGGSKGSFTGLRMHAVESLGQFCFTTSPSPPTAARLRQFCLCCSVLHQAVESLRQFLLHYKSLPSQFCICCSALHNASSTPLSKGGAVTRPLSSQKGIACGSEVELLLLEDTLLKVWVPRGGAMVGVCVFCPHSSLVSGLFLLHDRRGCQGLSA